ncbi:MAG: septum formation initiator family protein [Spirochaetia bacterium]
MSRKSFYSLLLIVPVLLFLNGWQAYRYYALEKEIDELEQVQNQLFEENKKAIAAISVLNSPARIAEIARELDMEKAELDRIIRVVFQERDTGK